MITEFSAVPSMNTNSWTDAFVLSFISSLDTQRFRNLCLWCKRSLCCKCSESSSIKSYSCCLCYCSWEINSLMILSLADHLLPFCSASTCWCQHTSRLSGIWILFAFRSSWPSVLEWAGCSRLRTAPCGCRWPSPTGWMRIGKLCLKRINSAQESPQEKTFQIFNYE